MKKIFYISLILFILYELAGVYFIMPMPGSQTMDSVGFAWFLHHWRIPIRIIFILGLIAGFRSAWSGKKWVFIPMLVLLVVAIYFTNGPLTASSMFRPLTVKKFAGKSENKIRDEKLVIGVIIRGEARAYPIQMIGYHHRVLDTVGGQAVFVTYCTVCRTGRVFEPSVDGKPESFRLVGMDHFNAMFEDKTTGSWWRQATGEACAGPLKGKKLKDIPCVQMTVTEWFRQYPQGKVLQWDTTFRKKYEAMEKYDRGLSKSKLTGTDTASWNNKSWVLGIESPSGPRAYDWNYLKKNHFIADDFNGQTLLILLHKDTMGYSAWTVNIPPAEFQNANYFPSGGYIETPKYSIYADGVIQVQEPSSEPLPELKKAQVYQEFWHSWRTFHPGSTQFPDPSETK